MRPWSFYTTGFNPWLLLLGPYRTLKKQIVLDIYSLTLLEDYEALALTTSFSMRRHKGYIREKWFISGALSHIASIPRVGTRGYYCWVPTGP